MAKYCPYCGKEIPKRSTICPHCGMGLDIGSQILFYLTVLLGIFAFGYFLFWLLG